MNMAIKNYRDFTVWQKSMQAVKLLYSLVKKLPKEELFALSDQMRRCVVSIPSNIVEGQQRNSDAEFVRFLDIAQGSRAELETQLQICVVIGYLTEEEIAGLMDLLEEISRMLSSLIRTLSTTK